MPPSESPTGAVTAKVKAVVRDWIAAGAPTGKAPSAQGKPSQTGPPGSAQGSSPTKPEGEKAGPPQRSGARRVLNWFGKFHLLLLHFPIALLAAAAAGELWCAWKGAQAPSQAVRFCLCLAAVAVAPTVALGWLYALAGHGARQPEVLGLHRWLATVAGLWVIAAAVLSERDARRGVHRWRVRVLVPVGALLVGLTAHFGGALAHGLHFFDW
jgi:hypothetical protein